MSRVDGQWGLGLDLPEMAGFRLWNVEVLNWGTFDGSIVSFPIEGKDAFVTGAVGAGKSTVVDALTTLFVPTTRIVYNKAAGAGRNERRLETYLKGVYSTAADDTGTRSKPVALRDTKHVTAILAHFRDEQANVDAVFAHVYYFTAAGSIEKVYAVSDKPITLEVLLAGANSDPRTLQRLIGQRMTKCGPWRDYLLAVRRMLGLPHEQALDLWFQTVSMKQVENLTAFVRSHMLEPPDDTRKKIEDLIGHYRDLTGSAAAIDRAKDQLGILTPLVLNFDDYDQHAGDGDDLARVRDQVLEDFYQAIEIGLVDGETAAADAKAKAAAAQRKNLDGEIKAINDRIGVLDKTITDQGGAALVDLERQIQAAETESLQRKERRRLFDVRCGDAGVTPSADLDGFLSMRAGAQRLHDKAAADAEEQKPEYETIAALHGKQAEARKIEGMLQSLRNRKSNLDPDLLALRVRIADAAGLTEDDLPFVGELLQVRPARRDWEPAVQRLLYGFGSTLLVPESAYSVVSDWVDSTNLRGRLTYQAIPAETRPAGRPSPGTLPDVLDVARSLPMSVWLGSEIMRRFRGFALAESTADFRRSEQAITKAGQVKRPGRLHEKDDRFPIGDRRRYVLGWDNKGKVEALLADATALAEEIRGLEETLRTAEGRARASQKVMNAADTLLREYQDFTAVDVAGIEERLTRLRADRNDLLSGSSTLTSLRAQKDKEENTRERLAARWEDAVGNVAKWSEKATELAARRSGLPETKPVVGETEEMLLTGLHATAQQRIASVTLANIDRVKTSAREGLQGLIDAAVKRATRARDAAIKAMEQLKLTYAQDTMAMDAAMESANDFRALHQRLSDDDLPRFEAEFRRQLSENTLREVAGFNQHLEERRGRIKDRVDRINEPLMRIDYTRDTYIALEPSQNPDPDIAAFRRDLKECIDGTLGGGEDAYTRERFEQVKAIVERFDGRDTRAEEDRTWTARVTDVRNWYLFAIVERNRGTGETVAYYSDSEGKSGGEKEKLAYTVLAAALSYQFGLVPGDPRPKTFRFIALDEAFARGSDTSTQFALQLFKTMGLQLLIVTPLQKKEVIAPYVQRVALITRQSDYRSRSLFMKVEEYRERLEASKQRKRESADAGVGS